MYYLYSEQEVTSWGLVLDSKQMESTILKMTAQEAMTKDLCLIANRWGIEALGQDQGAQGCQRTCKEQSTYIG